jgi:benzoyl-CoA reductase/2-hydroxyglutaryl-CoA dehydratase subunit BcrC/BadD/HgdB
LIGITTTIPVEIVYAAGLRPIDLNNRFITSSNPEDLVVRAEKDGFAHNICAWIKGIYGTVLERKLTQVVAVTGGDCSNTIALGEVLAAKDVEVIPFAFPLNRARSSLHEEMDQLRRRLGTSWEEIYLAKKRLDRIRGKLKSLDELTYLEDRVSGLENHLFLVNSSDFNGDPDAFENHLDDFLSEAKARRPRMEKVRLGYVGVPAIFEGFYEFIESLDARVVYNEIQRQFSMPLGKSDMIDQYLAYTYPYALEGRLRDILEAIEARQLDGLIHYSQSFCHRQIYDILFREKLQIPILTLEGDRPAPLDSRTCLRIETFIQMLKDRAGQTRRRRASRKGPNVKAQMPKDNMTT